MAKFLIEPHFRLQEWVAEEKDYFRQEGLDYEFRELVRATDGKIHDKGSKGAVMFTGTGDAELHADVVLKTRDGVVAAKLAVMGNSKRQSSTSIGGFNTAWADSLPARAVRATIEQITEYLQSRG